MKKSITFRSVYLFFATLLSVTLQLSAQPYPPESYELSADRKTLVKWKGDETELDLTADPVFNAVTTISKSAFAEHKELVSVVLPNLVTTINQYAFAYCDLLSSVTLPASLSVLDEGVFSNCKSLKTIELPSSLSAIGEYTFAFCLNLESISLPSSLTKIPNYAFFKCTSLTSIELPASLTSIGEYAFFKCTILPSIVLPNTLTEIGKSAFQRCEKLTAVTSLAVNPPHTNATSFKNCPLDQAVLSVPQESLEAYQTTIPWKEFGEIKPLGGSVIPSESYELSADGKTLIKWKGAEAEIDLSSDPGFSSVEKIGEYAFGNNANLTTIVLPNTLTSIEKCAFSYCSALSSVSLPSSLLSLGNEVFSNCSHLASIELPSSLSSIGDEVFKGCSVLTSIVLPSSLSIMGKSVFSGCTQLSSVTLPTSLTEISGGTFTDCSSLTSIEWPSSLLTIGGTAFKGCTSLKSIMLPASVTHIKVSAFKECIGLESIILSESLTYIGRSAFQECRNLTSIELPPSVVEIGKYAFRGCEKLSEVTSLPITPPQANENSFKDCPLDQAILFVPKESIEAYQTTIPWKEFGEIKSIGNSGISPDSYLLSEDGKILIEWKGAETEIDLSSDPVFDSVIAIGKKAFYNCPELTTITLPTTLRTIGESAFANCALLSSIVLPNSVTDVDMYAFAFTGLESITISNSLITLGEGVFSNCTKLTAVDLPASLKNMGDYAFAFCLSLSSVNLPESLTTIPGYSFFKCTSLESIELPTSLTTIGEYAFFKCTVLSSIVLPNTLTEIKKAAFQRCEKLIEVTSLSVDPPLSKDDIFNECPLSQMTLFVPRQGMNEYKITVPWKNFGTIKSIEGEDAVVTFAQPAHGFISLMVDGQSVESGSLLPIGTIVNVIATPADHYELLSISVNGEVIDGTSFVVGEENHVTAIFALEQHAVTFIQPENGTLTLKATDSAISSGDKLEYGTIITIDVTPNAGYLVDMVMINGQPLNPPYLFILGEDSEVTALMKKAEGLLDVDAVFCRVYPNPTHAFVMLEVSEQFIGQTAYMIDVKGHQVLSVEFEDIQTRIDVSSLSVGTYFLRVGSEVRKVIIR